MTREGAILAVLDRHFWPGLCWLVYDAGPDYRAWGGWGFIQIGDQGVPGRPRIGTAEQNRLITQAEIEEAICLMAWRSA